MPAPSPRATSIAARSGGGRTRARPPARIPAGRLRDLRGRATRRRPTPRCWRWWSTRSATPPVDLVTGDLGLLLAAIDALDTSAARKAALRRHVWRPARFHALLHGFGDGHAAATAARAALLAAEAAGETPARVAAAGRPVGLRDAGEVAARVARLAEEAATPPLDAAQVGCVEAVLAVAGTCREALDALTPLARRFRGLEAAVARFAARLEALAARGIDPDRLRFEASFGRTTLEYYDGFVFGALPRGRDDLPPIASGGRYDALTRVLGKGRGIPAVGGIVRPEALVALSGGRPCR